VKAQRLSRAAVIGAMGVVYGDIGTSPLYALEASINAAGAPVSFVELSSPFGHDAFLLDMPEMNRVTTRGRAASCRCLRWWSAR